MVDASGEELPAAAAEGATLVPMTVQGGAADPEGAAATMSEVLASLPDPLRGAVREVSASSTSDVTLVLTLEDGGTKTVVWGDAHDAELKAEVVQALLGRPGTTIDVSSRSPPSRADLTRCCHARIRRAPRARGLDGGWRTGATHSGGSGAPDGDIGPARARHAPSVFACACTPP